MLAGTAAFDRKSYKEAIRFWERLRQDLPAWSEILPDVEVSLHEARALSGEKVSGEKVAAPSAQKSGDAKLQAGDLEGISAAVAPDGRVVDIEIDQVVQ